MKGKLLNLVRFQLLCLFSLVGYACASNSSEDGSSGDSTATQEASAINDGVDTLNISLVNDSTLRDSLPYKHHPTAPIKMSQLTGINAFEWDFLQNLNDADDIEKIYEPNMNIIRSFGAVRHFLDWENMETDEGHYTFNPAHKGSWNYDLMYSRCKAEGMEVLVCIKNSPPWLYETYPAEKQDEENVPAAYGAKRDDPRSYQAMGRLAFQFAARYGKNKAVDSALVSVNRQSRWAADRSNEVKIGLGLINYIECNNEPDRWWKGPDAQQSASEYAANLSAFYDGDKGRLGKGVGVKAADPHMKVVMGGLAKPDINYVKEIVNWCRKHRGLKADGTVDLCFDVLNFHMYSNDNSNWFAKTDSAQKRGIAPEMNNMAAIADQWTAYAETLGLAVWTTELGYDLDKNSIQRAIPIGEKSVLETQADWILRSSLLYARHGVERVFFYQLFDTDEPGVTENAPFSHSGLADLQHGRRPAATYLYQVNRLMGNYAYEETINANPVVDRYKRGEKSMFVLYIPDEKGRKASFDLDLRGAKKAVVHYLNIKGDKMLTKEMPVKDGKINLEISETPIFVENG